ncbi:MAG TPA: ATP-binding cassette domain-containing protein [Patescibacteria group bacterium]|nr:ATP-binding cassette domain-containing protein [Patescibacteria group bacterium]
MENTKSDPTNIVEVHNLIKRYGSFTAVDNISFNVPHGNIFAFLGPNGAGKTTTIKMLTTLLLPTSGTLLINGFDAVKDPQDVRKSFGIVFQDPSLEDELTAYENMEFHAVLYSVPKDDRKKRIQDLLEFVELWNRKDELVKNFSGGMKRRLEIARGLLHHPKIFFLDEPTQGLDPQTRNHIWHYLQDLSIKEGISIFFTTHYLEEAQEYANRIAIMDHGHIVKEGTVDTIKKDTGKETLEEAFLSLTGTEIRDEEASGVEQLRRHRQMRGR